MSRMKLFCGLLRTGACLLFSCSVLAQSQDLEEKSHRAKELMTAQQYEEAVPIYRELVRALPNNPGLRMNLGLALNFAGHKREAVREFEKVLKLDPRNAVAWLFLGTAYLDLGDAAKALAPLEKAVKAQPESSDAQEALAEAWLELGKFQRSSRTFQELSRSDPESPKVWYGLGLSYDGLAQQNFEELAKVAPESGWWLDLVAESRLGTQQDYSAFFLYRHAQEKMPSLRGVHAAVAEIYRKTGHADWAAIEDAKERQLPPPDCAREKFECDFQAGRYSEMIASAQGQITSESYYWRTRAYNRLARDAYKRLGDLPPSEQMHVLMAKIELKRRQYAEAAKQWQEALKSSPANAYLKKQLAIALFQSSDLPRALELFQSLLETEPESPELNYYLGDTLSKSQKPLEALPYLTRAVSSAPDLLAAHASLARTYLALGQSEKAIPHLKAALSIDEDGSLHYQLGRAYQAKGETALARETLKQYQEIHNRQEADKQTLNREIQITPP